ncbi:MAG: hypothetical protein HZB26_03405 [Candidatus Hydrogenedentes bacterium]|nr:hypothetical protein [Candidatus Hydrogenedentota bacterium]
MGDTRGYLDRAVRSWVKLWVAYNVLFIGVFSYVILVMRGSRPGFIEFIIRGLVILAMANTVFCVGPVVDCFVYAILGMRLGGARYVFSVLTLVVFLWSIFAR